MNDIKEDTQEIVESILDLDYEGYSQYNPKLIEQLKKYQTDYELKDVLRAFQMQLLGGFRAIQDIFFSDIQRQEKSKIIIEIINGNYEHFLKEYFNNNEGALNCNTKALFVVDKTIQALREQANLSLYDDYMNDDKVTEHKERRAYWSPETIDDTDTAIEMFWDWYYVRE